MFSMLLFFILLRGQRIVSERLVNGQRIRWPFTWPGPLGQYQRLIFFVYNSETIIFIFHISRFLQSLFNFNIARYKYHVF